MKCIHPICFFFVLIVGCNSQNSNNSHSANHEPPFVNVFETIRYDSVVAYNYNGEAGKEIIDDSGRLSRKIHKRIPLKESQVQRFSAILCNPSTYGGPMAACFDPHLGIVYYAENKPKAFLSICLECNSLSSSIKIKAADSGFSDSGIVSILNFQKEIGYQ